jgi:hypothetical protein
LIPKSDDYPAFADTREAWLLANLINAVKKLDYRDYTKNWFHSNYQLEILKEI